MALRIVCDRLMCGRYEDTRFGEPPDTWVTVSREGQHRDSSLRSVYCSTRCAVMALGGEWRATTLSAEWLNIPWPPSDELVERVAKAIHDRRCQCRITTHWPAWLDEARAVLDAIFGEAVTDV